MSSPPDASGTGDHLSPPRRALPSVPGAYQPTRKAPPSPLAISSSSLSRKTKSPKPPPSSSSTPNTRISLESSKSDLTSRSDLTSLHCSEFPVPPSALPPIPASPLTAKSLHFSTTPTTPRSQSPHSGFLPLQDPPRAGGLSLLGSPKSLKSLFSGSRSPAPQSQFAAQQDHLPDVPGRSEPQGSTSLEDLKHGYEQSKVSVPARYSQYAVYKDSNQGAGASRPVTPMTATPTHYGSLSSSGRSSPLQPPLPAYVTDEMPSRPPSSSRNGSSFATQQEETKYTRSQSPTAQSPRTFAAQPPRSPLPALPTKRDSARDSASYSHIARQAGVTDMGMDISEEQLLSTDFITEMLRHPVTSSPRSARLLQLPDSPQSALSDDYGLGRHIRGSEMCLVPDSNLALASPSGSRSLEPVSAGIPGTDYQPSDFRVRSGLASSVFPKGGDKVYVDETSSLPVSPLPVSPNSQSLAAPAYVLRGHASPHPLVPSTPMSAESFADGASPQASHGFAQAQAIHFPVWRRAPTSPSIASRLPIGPSSATATAATRGPNALLPRLGPPRVRQHHYPRQGFIKSVTQMDQTPATPAVQDAPVSSGSSSSPMDSNKQDRESTGVKSELPMHAESSALSPRKSHVLSALSHTSSTRTQRDSLTSSPTLGSRSVSAERAALSIQRSSFSQAHSRESYESNFLSSDSLFDEDESNLDGEVQTASRVMDTAAPLIIRAGDVSRPTVVGMATAVVVRSKSTDRRAAQEAAQNPQHLNAGASISGFQPELSTPPSPRHPPSIDSPPSHRTDIPESAKSFNVSEDVHHEKLRTYLPHEEVAGYGSAFWDATQNAAPAGEHSTGTPKFRPSKPGSVKSVISFITTRSKASTVASKVTKASHRSNHSTGSSRWAWLKRKPLPPLPPPSPPSPPSPSAGEIQFSFQKNNTGGSSPILQLGQYQKSKVALTGAQQGEPQGWRDITQEKWAPGLTDGESDTPALSYMNSFAKVDMFGADSLKVAKRKASRSQGASKRNKASDYGTRVLSRVPEAEFAHSITRHFRPLLRTKARKWLFFSLIGIVILAVILGAALGSLGHKHNSGSGSSPCSGNQTGVKCNLDATCTCPSSISGTCAAPLAQALNSLVAPTSQLFAANITSAGLALVLYASQGTPITPNCVTQANFVDVGSVLDASRSPNRTQWAQAALLWTLFQTGDGDATRSLQSAVTSLPFGSLHNTDGIESDPTGKFTVSSSGYTYNFANQTVSAPSLTFDVDASPSSLQVSRLNSAAEGSLDRMYSFASASSTQQQAALSTYWRSVLSLSLSDLPTFLTAFKSSPVLLPFDATASPGGQAISSLLTDAINRTLSFPPAIGCYPGLSPSQLQRINAVETQAFGLAALNSTSSTFDSSCFSNHPVYGVLDVLRTRLPFSDSRSGVAQQASVLTSDAASRVVLHVGELLSALPAPNTTDLTAFGVNPRGFGTLSHLNHIALGWLRSFPTTALAAEAARFVLSSPTSPPTKPGILNATSLPIVEVAIFGDVFLPDLSSFVSSFSTPSGSLFFGSSEAQAYRRWALQQSTSATIVWSPSTFSSQTVREGSSSNAFFEQIWSNATSLTAGPTNTTTVQKVVNDLASEGLFSS
ncbi:hypothetical protein JB92DRAFT_2837048 [Gautieria morchelliformis]|nr:hypothetical protein JB92DRAFT_2837048 [Gautieria morchelliformis]